MKRLKMTDIKIADIHAHVFPDPIARKASDSIGEFYHMPVRHDGTADKLLGLYRDAGISLGCIHSVAITPHSIDSINRFISETVKKHPGILSGFGAVHPGRKDLLGLIDEVLELGLIGLKIHPDMQKFALDSREAMDMFASIEDRLPVIIHTGDSRYEYSRPWQMKHVLDAFPKLVCVCAHLGGWSEWDEASKMLAGYENVYVDTSSSLYALAPEKACRIIRCFSRDRVLFGTDYPMWNPAEELERFNRLGLTDDEQEKILSLNAMKLLGIRG